MLLAAAILAVALPAPAPGAYQRNTPPDANNALELDDLGERVLIFAPHPDDECLAAGGLIQRCARAGSDVRVVVLTCGDGAREAACSYFGEPEVNGELLVRLGRERADESRRACGVLGIGPEDVLFLGYPDGGLQDLMDEHYQDPCPYTGLTGCERCPYEFACSYGSTYSGESLKGILMEIVRDFDPSAIVYPDQCDSHPDHRAAFYFVERCLFELDNRGSRFTYMVHFPDRAGIHYDNLLGHSTSPLGVPTSPSGWATFFLETDEVRLKESAITEYEVPMTRIEEFMRSFADGIEHYRRRYPPLSGSPVEKAVKPARPIIN